ncbi:flagellar basal body-associated protein FliL [Alteribacter natronophilus]|uniref:flagellar basal body-associated protein FliL n=1 Tax=Alteribacter natronophilus TaxID=2583810 RepID=UPI00110F4BC4|nr:flagellar basal body-associated protein FliL [Alteribacter natronophilus]TMW73221.1 flagellar basal body-associated protein FliL [Alteribacter natronophilus]
MFKNRLVTYMLIILFLMTAAGTAVLFFVSTPEESTEAHAEPDPDEEIAMQVDTDQITTNLKSGNIIRTRFVIQLSTEEAAQEFEKRNFQAENVILQMLADLDAAEFEGSGTIRGLEEQLKTEFNSLVHSGEVTRVYTQEWIVQ